MKNPLLKSLSLGALLVFVSNPAFSASKEEAATKLGATDVTEVQFAKSATDLSKTEQQQLKDALAAAEKKGKVNAVKLLVWSDKEYPTTEAKADDKDVKLAKARLSNLKKYIKKDLKVWDVGTYNMAERPNAIEKLLRTADARVKESAETAGLAPDTKKELGLFDRNAQASKAVILIYTKE